MKYTLVFEWRNGEEPGIGAADTFKGGKLCSAQFSDALEELEALYSKNPGLTVPTYNAELTRLARRR